MVLTKFFFILPCSYHYASMPIDSKYKFLYTVIIFAKSLYPEFPYNQIALATLLYCRVATATPSGVAVATRQCSVTLFYQVT